MSSPTVECPAAVVPPPAVDPVVSLRAVRKTYSVGGEEVRALDGVDWHFERGSFWAIMGPSGSGKSTMLNVLGCLDRPSAGDYFLDGVKVSDLDDDALSGIRLAKLGFVFQSFHLIPQLSVVENIGLPLSYLGWDKIRARERAAELADKVGLGQRLEHRPVELSGGQQQRVAIARALANDPAILLADEPTGNLDSRTGRQIMDLLLGLNAAGRTIIMVTHTLETVASIPNHLHMRDGRVEDFTIRRAETLGEAP